MLIDLLLERHHGRRIVNTDQISLIECVGKDLYHIHLVGQEEPLSYECSNFDFFRRFCGRIINAPPGYNVVVVSLDEKEPAKPTFVYETPVIAFRYEDEQCTQLKPITVEEGELRDGGDWALMYPDGHLSNGFNYYKDKKKAVAKITKDLRQRLKSAAEQKQLKVVK